MFKNNNNFKYIDLIYDKDLYLNITETTINWKDYLIICQKKDIIINPNQYCYYNTELYQCKSDHYMILFYGKDIFYEFGSLQVTNNNTNT